MPHETLLCATAPPVGNTQLGAGTLSLCDLQTGSVLASFKQTSASPRGVAVVDTDASTAEGGLMFAAQADKALLQVYNFQKVGECCAQLAVRACHAQIVLE
jgi:pre-rRNA-processing protein IPI3